MVWLSGTENLIENKTCERQLGCKDLAVRVDRCPVVANAHWPYSAKIGEQNMRYAISFMSPLWRLSLFASALLLAWGCSSEEPVPKNPAGTEDSQTENPADDQTGDTNTDDNTGDDSTTCTNDSGSNDNTGSGDTGNGDSGNTDTGNSGDNGGNDNSGSDNETPTCDTGTDTGNNDAPNSDCDRSGFSTNVHEAMYGTNAFQYKAQSSTNSPFDLLLVTSYQDGFDGPTTPGTYSVDGTNYADCGLCLLALTDCAEGGNCQKTFYADLGSVTISQFGQDGGIFSGSLSGVVFKEVTIDEQTYTSTPVAGGDTWCVNELSFSVQVGQGLVTPDTGGSGTTTDPTDDGSTGDNSNGGDDSSNGGNDTTTPTGDGIPVLGNGSHSLSGVSFTSVAGTAHGLDVPRDIGFHPQRPEELWVANWGDSSSTVLFRASSAAVWMCNQGYYGTSDGCDQGCGVQDPDCQNGSQQVYNNCSQGHQPSTNDPTRCTVPGGSNENLDVFARFHKRLPSSNSGDYQTNLHFHARPSALAFGANGNMATAHEEDAPTQASTPGDFMGPTMWDTQLNLFNSAHTSHLDMLHNSPNAMGIAWESGNAYWVVDGYHGSLTRYDFNQDHSPGGTDHADGVVYRYANGQLGYEEGVPAHAVYDNGTLYAADPANNRIVSLDTQSGSLGSNISPNYDGSVQRMMNGTNVSTFINGGSVSGMSKPSGIELYDNKFFVSDNATSKIFAFNRQGELLDWLDLGLPAGSIMGMAFDSAGLLYVVDALGQEVYQISPAN